MKTQAFKPDSRKTEAEFLEEYRSQIESGFLTESYVRARWRYIMHQGSYQDAHAEYLKTKAYQAQLEINRKYPV